MKPYYYVYNISGEAPKFKHEKIDEAHAEAERLARENPNKTFEILMCLGITITKNTNTFWMDGVEPGALA